MGVNSSRAIAVINSPVGLIHWIQLQLQSRELASLTKDGCQNMSFCSLKMCNQLLNRLKMCWWSYFKTILPQIPPFSKLTTNEPYEQKFHCLSQQTPSLI